MARLEIAATDSFERELKRLSKKYSSLKRDVARLVTSLNENPELGSLLPGGVRKVRLAIESKGKGKSGGGRVITLLLKAQNRLYLLFIYDKSEVDSLASAFVDDLIRSAVEGD